MSKAPECPCYNWLVEIVMISSRAASLSVKFIEGN